jgi:2-methylisocitrate lyase-like PEP mutase family enzyme
MEKVTTQLRKLLAGPGCVVAPVSPTARRTLVKLRGFDAVHDRLRHQHHAAGHADVGLLTATEMIDNASRIVDASELPVVADADTGYGNPINTRRTIRDYEKAGVAGVHIEDQGLAQALRRISPASADSDRGNGRENQAACDARRDPDFVIITRTDAIAIERTRCGAGARRALSRSRRRRAVHRSAGRPRRSRPRVKTLQGRAAALQHGIERQDADLPADELGKLGFRIAIYPNWVILAAIPAMQNMLAELKRTGSIAHMRDKVATFKEFTEIAGLPDIMELEERYGLPEDQRASL